MIRAFQLILALLLLAVVPALCKEAAPDLPRIMKDVEAIRSLPFKRPVPSAVQARQDIVKYVERELDKENDWPTYDTFLKAFGFVPEGYQTRAEMLALFGEQVGGYYDPGTRKFYLAKDWMAGQEGDVMGVSMQDVAIAHELTHAMQDQYFDLNAIEKSLDAATEDRKLAVSSVIEGEATNVMIEEMFKEAGMSPDILQKAGLGDMTALLKQSLHMDNGQYPRFSHAPLYFRGTMTFPYINGNGFIDAVRKAGGWKKVSDVYLDLPTSSTQILHPERYLGKRPAPASIRLARLPEGRCRLVTEGTLGEYLTGLLLEQYAPSHPSADDAAAGWRADAYQVYKDPQGHVFLVWVTEWDTEAEARLFAAAYGKALPARRKELVATSAGEWKLPGRAAVSWIERRGKRVLAADAVPTDLKPAINGLAAGVSSVRSLCYHVARSRSEVGVVP